MPKKEYRFDLFENHIYVIVDNDIRFRTKNEAFGKGWFKAKKWVEKNLPPDYKRTVSKAVKQLQKKIAKSLCRQGWI